MESLNQAESADECIITAVIKSNDSEQPNISRKSDISADTETRTLPWLSAENECCPNGSQEKEDFCNGCYDTFGHAPHLNGRLLKKSVRDTSTTSIIDKEFGGQKYGNNISSCNQNTYLRKGENQTIAMDVDVPELSAIHKFLFDQGKSLVVETCMKNLIQSEQKNINELVNQGIRLEKSHWNQLIGMINQLERTLDYLKKQNSAFTFELKHCRYCTFTTESYVVLQNHLESFPHFDDKNRLVCCLCEKFEPVKDKERFKFVEHMLNSHHVLPKFEFSGKHSCDLCYYDCSTHSQLKRHREKCFSSFNLSKNLAPPQGFTPALAIPMRPIILQELRMQHQQKLNQLQPSQISNFLSINNGAMQAEASQDVQFGRAGLANPASICDNGIIVQLGRAGRSNPASHNGPNTPKISTTEIQQDNSNLSGHSSCILSHQTSEQSLHQSIQQSTESDLEQSPFQAGRKWSAHILQERMEHQKKQENNPVPKTITETISDRERSSEKIPAAKLKKRRKAKIVWNAADDMYLKSGVEKYGHTDWSAVLKYCKTAFGVFDGLLACDLMQRWNCLARENEHCSIWSTRDSEDEDDCKPLIEFRMRKSSSPGRNSKTFKKGANCRGSKDEIESCRKMSRRQQGGKQLSALVKSQNYIGPKPKLSTGRRDIRARPTGIHDKSNRRKRLLNGKSGKIERDDVHERAARKDMKEAVATDRVLLSPYETDGKSVCTKTHKGVPKNCNPRAGGRSPTKNMISCYKRRNVEKQGKPDTGYQPAGYVNGLCGAKKESQVFDTFSKKTTKKPQRASRLKMSHEKCDKLHTPKSSSSATTRLKTSSATMSRSSLPPCWTDDEISALKEGVEIIGRRQWTAILQVYKCRLHATRTWVHLRDKWNDIMETPRGQKSGPKKGGNR